jgi:hypothetical protein
MTTIQMLENAIHERIAKENAFKDAIVSHINLILSRLPICDTSHSSEVSNTVTLSREKLESILAKIKDYKSINQFAVKELVAKLNLNDIRRGASNEKDEKDYFSDPSNVERAFRFADANQEEKEEEFHFGGKRTKSRRR